MDIFSHKCYSDDELVLDISIVIFSRILCAFSTAVSIKKVGIKMINKMNIFLILLISIVFGILNFKVYMIGDKPNLTQGFISIFFIVLWLLYGFIMGRRNSKHFIKNITAYWVLGFALNLITLFFNWFIISIPLSCIFLTPLYGLRYFFREPLTSNFFYIVIIVTYLAGVFGYFLGRVVKNNKSIQ